MAPFFVQAAIRGSGLIGVNGATRQANDMVQVGGGQAQAVIWSLREPTLSAVNKVSEALGENANRVQFVDGVEGLYKWIELYSRGASVL